MDILEEFEKMKLVNEKGEIKNVESYFPGKDKETLKNVKKEELIKNIKEAYDLILEILEYYMDLNEGEKKLIAVWTIGSAIHKSFDCFPYLYFNAMRGSGKTRLMKIITFLTEGILTTSPTEAVLFRSNDLLALDEFERMDAKEKLLLKEMLNTAYKKGLFVLRTMKKRRATGEVYEIEKYETFRPIIMANIWGMDDVLGDRCISLVLEKSNNSAKTKKMETFEMDENMKKVRTILIQCRLCSDVSSQDIYNITKNWNNYIHYKNVTSLTTHITYNTHTTQTSQPHSEIIDEKLFLKIDNTNLDGRILELFFPLFIVANYLGDEKLQELIDFSKKIVEEKKTSDAENKDVLLYKFISEQIGDLNWHSVKDLCNHFKLFLGEENEDWVNPKWFGRALKRLNLVNSKRRIGAIGAEVILNVNKAAEKSKIFKKDANN